MRLFVIISSTRFRWSIHNIVGHPLAEIASLFGFKKLADVIHDSTIPFGPEDEITEEYDDGWMLGLTEDTYYGELEE